jgi:hypothetical protein
MIASTSTHSSTHAITGIRSTPAPHLRGGSRYPPYTLPYPYPQYRRGGRFSPSQSLTESPENANYSH